MSGSVDIPAGLLRFTHPAMATTFELYVAGESLNDARPAAAAAFAEVDRVEADLSQFIPDSDVSRINRLQSGASVRVSTLTADCLELARRVHHETEGAFDATVGALLEGRRPWREEDGAELIERSLRTPAREPRVGMDLIQVDVRRSRVSVVAGDVALDLGGIGKGIALDRAIGVLQDLGLQSVLVHGGQSTMIPIGLPPGLKGWPMRILDPCGESKVLGRCPLKGVAVSASARGSQPHILNPRTEKIADTPWTGTWAFANTAARADALSTAFMVMDVDAVARFCKRYPPVGAVVVHEVKGQPVPQAFGTLGVPDIKWDA